jgi:hypothetical protein
MLFVGSILYRAAGSYIISSNEAEYNFNGRGVIRRGKKLPERLTYRRYVRLEGGI